jgi:hypothetical protein
VNIERIKEICAKKENDNFSNKIMTRAYFILGFCYCKSSDQTPNYEDKVQSLQLALSSFKEVIKVCKY